MGNDLKDLMGQAKDLNSDRFERKLNSFVRTHHRYSNLDSKNREVVNDLVHKYKDRLRHKGGICGYAVRREMYKLNQKKDEMGLTKNDLRDIRKMMKGLKK